LHNITVLETVSLANLYLNKRVQTIGTQYIMKDIWTGTKLFELCWVWSFHISDYENDYRLQYNAL
jgi:hypothetical protein